MIFDPAARRYRRDRSAHPESAFLAALLADDLLARLEAEDASTPALLLGAEPRLAAGLAGQGIDAEAVDIASMRAALLGGRVATPDDLGLPAGRYALILSCGLLDVIDDLPGAFVQLRRALQPGGLLLANFAGAPSLPALRAAVAAADAPTGRAVARFHPQIDVRSAGDLLQRTGFVAGVADSETRTIAYRSADALLSDLREAGMTNCLRERHPAGREWFERLRSALVAGAAPDGRIHETVGWITVAGRAPSPR